MNEIALKIKKHTLRQQTKHQPDVYRGSFLSTFIFTKTTAQGGPNWTYLNGKCSY